MEGTALSLIVGIADNIRLGTELRNAEGVLLGILLGRRLGAAVGSDDGTLVGMELGLVDGDIHDGNIKMSFNSEVLALSTCNSKSVTL